MTPTDSANDTVNHPPHYTVGRIEAWELGFHLGNVVKYVARAAHKRCFLEDLRKARWYLDRQIELAAQQAATWDTQVQEAR